MIPRYHQALDFEALWREFPPPPDYLSGTYRLSRDEMRQAERLASGEQDTRDEIGFLLIHQGFADRSVGTSRNHKLMSQRARL